MDETYNYKSHLFTTTSTESTVELIEELKKANEELRKARKAALNLMEDAIFSKEAARKSEEKYRALFKSIHEGFAIYELKRNENGNVIDMIYHETNAAYEHITGLKGGVGRWASELIPGLEASWFERNQRVNDTGIAERAEDYIADLDRWFTGHFSCVGGAGSNLNVAIFDDITERKRREANLAFLAEISQDLVKLKNIEETISILGNKIGHYFHVPWCMFSELVQDNEFAVASYGWNDPQVPSLKGMYRMRDYLTDEQVAKNNAGELTVCINTQTDPNVDAEVYSKLGVLSFINVPLARHGFWLFQHFIMDNKPRQWRADEIELLQELTVRIWSWLEKARAEEELRKSEEKYRSLFNSIDEGFVEMEMVMGDAGQVVDWRWMAFNPAFERMSGLKGVVGKLFSEIVPKLEPEWTERYGHVVATGEALRFELPVGGLDSWFDVFVSRIGGEGSRRVAVVFNNITERKRAEERKEYLLRVSDALRPLNHPVDIEEVVTLEAMNHFNADRCYYCDIKDDNAIIRRDASRGDLTSVAGIYPLSEFALFKAAIEGKKPFVIDNIYTTDLVDEPLKQICIGLQIISYIIVPIVKQEKLVGLLCLVQRNPRRWKEIEVELLVETAERTWAAVERAKAEEAMRKSEAQLSAVFSVLPVGIGFVNPQGEIIFSNEEMKRYLPTNRVPSQDKELSNRWVADYADGDRVAKEDYPVALALRGEHIVPGVEFRYKEEEGNEIWTRVAAVPVTDGEGNTIGAVCMVVDIDKLKRSEEAIRKSERRLQRMVNVPRVGVLTFSYTGSLLQANDAFIEMMGYSCEEFENRQFCWLDFTAPQHVEASLQILEQLKLTKRGGPYEKECILKDGSFKWIMFVASDLGDGTIIEYAIDITERKKAEEAVQQSETRFRTLADAVPQVIWANNATGKAIYFNKRWYDYTGLNFDQSAGPGWQAVVHPDDAPASIEKWNKALETGEIFDTEYRLKSSDGQYRWFIGRNVPLKDEAGTVTNWFGSATDIEELKKTTEALSQSEARLRITMESATDYAIITMDAERKIERWSKGASQTFGYTEEEVIGKLADIIFIEEDKKAGEPQKETETARDTGRAADERWHKRKDGSLFFASGVMRPIQESGVTGYVKVLRDTTQQQLFTEELHRLVADRTIELQRSNEDLRQFAHVASHDLKEPVRKIKTFNNRIIDDFSDALPPRAKTYLGKIGIAADRMVLMIEGVLNYSKVSNTQQRVERVDLNEIIREIESDLEVLLQQKKGQIETNNLPTLSGYRLLLYQLFYNLILNSLKFAKTNEPSSIQINCEVVNQDEQKFYKIILSDNGIGFEQEYAESIFNTFARLHPADEYEGTGLGLALCKKIVERHNGRISATGEPGKGATFTIMLPVG